MAQDLVTLYNMALGAAGVPKLVSLPTEKSPEAEACNLWYPFVRDLILAAAFWQDAKAMEYLTVESERTDGVDWVSGDPEPGWKYAYKQPADCLIPRHLNNFAKFSAGSNANGEKLIYTGEEDAILIYTKTITNPALFNPSLFIAIVMGLASAITMPLHAKHSLAKDAREHANAAILDARLQSANMEELQFNTQAESLVARGYSGAIHEQMYLHPFGPLLTTLGGANVV